MTIRDMTKNVRTSTTVALWVCILAAVGLFIASFCVPPTGVIDGSVLRAGSLLFAFGSLAVLREAIREGIGAKLTHGNTTIEVKDLDGKNEEKTRENGRL
ncbi:MAG: hypothetical protein II229_01115 [Clostridia bacterium]|nr:hypothetical protein [Clostridia bacterium]